MMSSEIQRKLTTILAADAEGYSREMETDEVRTLGALRAARGVFARFIERHRGRIANTAGDGLIADFPSVVEAVQCAIEVQQELNAQKGGPGGALRFRIGIHLGDVIVDGDDLLGEGVNLAARLQTMAEPGGVLISQQVYDQVHAKLSVGFEYLGGKRAKNLSEEIPVYRVSSGKPPVGVASWLKPAARARAAPPTAQFLPDRDASEAEIVKARVVPEAKALAVVLAGFLLIDLATGAPFWMHWVAIILLAIFGMRCMPLWVPPWLSRRHARYLVILAALAAINAFSWSGYPWVLWPAGAVLMVFLTRRFFTRQH